VLPTLSIEQSFRPDPSEINTVMGRGEAIMVRGSLLPIYRLSGLFAIEEAPGRPEHRLLVVLEASGSRCCLEVDELLGQQQVVIKTLGKGIGRLRGVSGGAILGDGRVAPIIDVVGLLAQAQGIPAEADPAQDNS
jgi:two-component system chemotaxis sensor kinase CheA